MQINKTWHNSILECIRDIHDRLNSIENNIRHLKKKVTHLEGSFSLVLTTPNPSSLTHDPLSEDLPPLPELMLENER